MSNAALQPGYQFSLYDLLVPSKVGVVDARTARGFMAGVVDEDACGNKLLAAGIDSLKKYKPHGAIVMFASQGEIRLFCAQQPVATYFLDTLGKAGFFRHSPPIYSPKTHWVVRKGELGRIFRMLMTVSSRQLLLGILAGYPCVALPGIQGDDLIGSGFLSQ